MAGIMAPGPGASLSGPLERLPPSSGGGPGGMIGPDHGMRDAVEEGGAEARSGGGGGGGGSDSVLLPNSGAGAAPAVAALEGPDQVFGGTKRPLTARPGADGASASAVTRSPQPPQYGQPPGKLAATGSDRGAGGRASRPRVPSQRALAASLAAAQQGAARQARKASEAGASLPPPPLVPAPAELSRWNKEFVVGFGEGELIDCPCGININYGVLISCTHCGRWVHLGLRSSECWEPGRVGPTFESEDEAAEGDYSCQPCLAKAAAAEAEAAAATSSAQALSNAAAVTAAAAVRRALAGRCISNALAFSTLEMEFKILAPSDSAGESLCAPGGRHSMPFLCHFLLLLVSKMFVIFQMP